MDLRLPSPSDSCLQLSLSGLPHSRHPVCNRPILELRGGKGAWATTAKKDARATRSRWFRQFCGYLLAVRSGHTGLQDGKLQKFPILQENQGIRSKIDAFFPNDFDKKVKRSS